MRLQLAKIEKITYQLILIMSLAACTTVGMLNSNEMDKINNNQLTVVLIRIEASIENEPYQPFKGFLTDDNISIGLGSFNTGGVPKRIEYQRFLSKESRKEGWIYFLLEPGTYYLSVYPPRRMDAFSYEEMIKEIPPIGKFDIPDNKKFIYIGTINLPGFADPLCCLGGGDIMSQINYTEFSVNTKDSVVAKSLAEEHFTKISGHVETVPLQKYEGGPIILKHHMPEKTK